MTALPKPYFQDEAVTIYHGDCREIMPLLEPGSVGLVLTDPPYGVGVDYFSYKDSANNLEGLISTVHPELLRISAGPVAWFGAASRLLLDGPAFQPMPERVLIWAPRFTLSHTGAKGLFYRWHPIYLWHIPDTHDGPTFDVLIDACDGHNEWFHPGTKPLTLIRRLVGFCPLGNTILDPFMGSGTTLRAAKDLGRKAIGIEIEERYCEIAANRMAQGVLL